MTATTWNPSDANASFSGGLTNGNLTATCTGAFTNTWCGIRATNFLNAGLAVFEITCNSVDGTNGFIYGVSSASWNLSGVYLGNDGNAIGYQEGVGNVYYNNSTQIADVAWSYNSSSPTTTMMAVDFTHRKVWFFSPSNGKWNDDVIGNQNPATNTGGISLSVTAGPLAPSFVLHNGSSADKATLNTSGPFVNSVPAGFSSWDSFFAPAVRGGQLARETLLAGPAPILRAGQLVRETLYTTTVPLQAAAVVREALMPTTIPIYVWDSFRV